MRHISSALEITIAVLAVVLISTGLCYFWPDKDYGLSGWVQAVGSILAILAAGQIATSQARRQFEDARRLQRIDHARQAFRVARATSVIASRVGMVLFDTIKQFKWDRETFSDIAAGRRHFDKNLLVEMRTDLDAISLHEIPSARLIEELLNMRAAVRQASENIDRALATYRKMDAHHFDSFFNMLDKVHLRLCLQILAIESIAAGLQREI